MADDGIFATNAEVLRKVGENASATSKAVAYTDQYLTEAEAFINTYTRYNWSDAYGALDVDVKGMLKEAASNLAACYVIQYDMFGYTQLEEAQTMINFLMARVDAILGLLRDKKHQEFMVNA